MLPKPPAEDYSIFIFIGRGGGGGIQAEYKVA